VNTRCMHHPAPSVLCQAGRQCCWPLRMHSGVLFQAYIWNARVSCQLKGKIVTVGPHMQHSHSNPAATTPATKQPPNTSNNASSSLLTVSHVMCVVNFLV
jgi:hypothetical protein